MQEEMTSKKKRPFLQIFVAFQETRDFFRSFRGETWGMGLKREVGEQLSCAIDLFILQIVQSIESDALEGKR